MSDYKKDVIKKFQDLDTKVVASIEARTKPVPEELAKFSDKIKNLWRTELIENADGNVRDALDDIVDKDFDGNLDLDDLLFFLRWERGGTE